MTSRRAPPGSRSSTGTSWCRRRSSRPIRFRAPSPPLAGLDNLVVSQTIYHAQQVPSAVFQPPLSTGTSLQIRATERAISIPVDTDSGLVGTLHDGDHVDVLLAYKGDNGGVSFTRPLLRNVLVLTAPDAKGGDGHVLLKLTDVDSTKLLYAEQYQKVWLVERPKTQAQDSPAALETASTVLFDGLSPGADRQGSRRAQDLHEVAERRVRDRRWGMSENPQNAPVRVFISGACAGLAEVRQALGTHPEIEIVGTAVEPARAAQKLAASNAQVVMHGSSRTDRMPVEDVEAIRQATSAPIVLVTTSSATGLLQDALSHGVADIVLLPQLTDALVFTIRRAHVMSAGRGRQAGAAHVRRGAEGKIITVFSPKGGVGRTTTACGLATIYARRHGRRTLLIDLDLQFGDCGIMMGLDPAKTIYDLVMTSGDLDPDKLASSVNVHPSGVHVIPAPVRPEDAELVAEDRVAHLLEVAKQAYDVIVVDTPAHFHSTTLATLDRTDRLALMASLDIPTVKNIKLTLQTLGMLHYPTERIGFILNRPQPRVELKQSEVEKALDMKAIGEIPYDREVPIAVNRGVPVSMSAPRSSVSKAIAEIAEILLPAPSTKARRPVTDEAPAPLEIGDGSTRGKRVSIRTKLRKAA